MRVALVTPWDNAWVPLFERAVHARGCNFSLIKKPSPEFLPADVYIHGWTGQYQPFPGARNVMFLRRYELFDGGLARVDWRHVDALICVNSWILDRVEEYFRAKQITVPTHLIYNAVDLDAWTYRQRAPNFRIGMACHVHPKKNLPLAVQILAHLPPEYELHVAGEVQDSATAEYVNHLAKALRRRVYFYHHIPREQLDIWWEQMAYCLSTSISEGNPNNVLEAMAKGIQPVVHNWPGAEHQFPHEWIFDVATHAAEMIWHPRSAYQSHKYREWVTRHFSLANIERVLDIALQPAEATA